MQMTGRIDRKIIGAYIVAFLIMLAIERCVASAASAEDFTGRTLQTTTNEQVIHPLPPTGNDSRSPQNNFSWDSAGDATPMVWVNLGTGVFYFPGEDGYGDPNPGRLMTEAEAVQSGCQSAENTHPE